MTDAYRLLDIFSAVTGKQAKMWGPTILDLVLIIINMNRHEGDTPVVGFSPRKARHSLYLLADSANCDTLLADFGKHKAGKSCIYVNKSETAFSRGFLFISS